jgi:hypothetical protein
MMREVVAGVRADYAGSGFHDVGAFTREAWSQFVGSLGFFAAEEVDDLLPANAFRREGERPHAAKGADVR